MATCKITYNGVQISESDQDAPVSVIYNGSTIASVDGGESKTLTCDGRYMASDVLVGTKRLLCGGKMMAGNIGVEMEDSQLYVTLIPNQTDATSGMRVDIGTVFDVVHYYNNRDSDTRIPVSEGESITIIPIDGHVYYGDTIRDDRESRNRGSTYLSMPPNSVAIRYSGNYSDGESTGDFLVDGIPVSRLIGFNYHTFSTTALDQNYYVKADMGGGGTISGNMEKTASYLKTVFLDYVTFEAFAKNGVFVNGVQQPSNTVQFKFNSLDFDNNEFHYDRTGSLLSYKYYVYVNGDVTVL